MNLRSSINHLKQISVWIWRGKCHLLSILATIVTVFYLTGYLNYHPNIVAAILWIPGLLIILTQQILDAKKFADYRPNTIHNWIKSYPRRKSIVMSAESGEYAIAFEKSDAMVSVSENATLESKVNFLLQEVKGIHSNIAKVDDGIDEVTSSLTSKSKELKADLENLNASLKTIIAGHIVGAYDINLLGITITICGTLIQFFCA